MARFLSFVALLLCLAVLSYARNPFDGEALETKVSNLDETLPMKDAEYKHVLAKPNEGEHSVLLLPSQQAERTVDGGSTMWEQLPIERHIPFTRVFGLGLGPNQRPFLLRRSPFSGRRPSRFGRPGGCFGHSQRKHFLMPMADRFRPHFPGRNGRDSVAFHLDFNGEETSFRILPLQHDSFAFEEKKPRFEPKEEANEDLNVEEVPKENIMLGFPREQPRHEDQGLGRLTSWVESLFNKRP